MDGGFPKEKNNPAAARISRLKRSIEVERYPLCVEKSRLLTESFKKTEGEPMVLRRAKALAHVLEHINIFIEDDELIVGNGASRAMGLELDFYAGLWPEDEIDSLIEEGFDISPEDKADVLDMNAYWRDLNLVTCMGKQFDDRLWPFMQSGMILPPWKSRETGSGGGYAESGMGLGPGFFLMTVDFELVLSKGLEGLMEAASAELARLDRATQADKVDYLEAVLISLRAVINFAVRFADLADELVQTSTDPTRAAELRAIADICRRVPAQPARNFREAMQSFWFLFLMITPSPTASLGRFDQYMYPFYQRDANAGAIDEEQVLELLQCLRIKDMQLNRTSDKQARQKNAGMAKWHNMTIGGVKPDGDDATNEMSYLIIEAARRCPVPHHTITLRVHDGTPDALLLKALEVVEMGTGFPAFVGDRSYIDYFTGEGVPLAEARDYALSGCIDASLPGNSRTVSCGMFIVPKVLEATLNNGVEPQTDRQLGPQTGRFEDFSSYDEFFDAFKQQLYHFLSLHAERNNIELSVSRDLFPDPVRSSLMRGGIEEGRALLDRQFDFENGAVMNPVGMINVVDSLAAVRHLVFEEKTVSQENLMTALEADWAGPKNQDLRKQILAAPKYGNGDGETDAIAKELFDFWAKSTISFPTCLGGSHKPTGVSVSSQWPGGLLTGATPDGRYAGECLADGTVSAMRGRDTAGPTGNIRSAIQVDQSVYQAALFNMKFHPSALRTEEDRRKLSLLIRTYFAEGGKHIQFNVVNREALMDAQQNPENYPDLLVRIAGYSARFVQLGKAMQDEIIGRTEHS
jgi:pyruvate formate-lyase/glycerol dehydratase family glycyl radical enzyme